MPLIERLRKGANCVGFLDGAPEPAADVADMLRKAADEIEQQRAALEAVDKWWLEDGMSHFTGAPYAIFAARAALSK
jgi:hypothetical protein